MSEPTKPPYEGGCLCGAVRYRVNGPLRPVVNCHCTQCRKTSGHHVAATMAQKSTLSMLEEKGLRWYESSDFAHRGFCQFCGGNLFWELTDPENETVSIMAGTLDSPTNLKTVMNIFSSDAGDYYTLDETLPQADGDYDIEEHTS